LQNRKFDTPVVYRVLDVLADVLTPCCCSTELASASAVSAVVNGLKLGLLVSLTQISHAAFSRTPAAVYLVNCGYDVVIVSVAGLIMYYV